MRQNHIIFNTVIAVVCLCSFCGCNPYASQFACPKTENGRCVSVSDAYAESLRPAPFESEEDFRNKRKDRQQVPDDLSWQREMQKKIGNLLKEPNAPLIAQPNVMRVLMLTGAIRTSGICSGSFICSWMNRDGSWVITLSIIRK